MKRLDGRDFRCPEDLLGIGSVYQPSQILAGNVTAGLDTLNVGVVASTAVTTVSKLLTVGLLWIGASEVLAGNLTLGQFIAFNMISGRVSAPVLRLAQIWQDFHQARLSPQSLVFESSR